MTFNNSLLHTRTYRTYCCCYCTSTPNNVGRPASFFCLLTFFPLLLSFFLSFLFLPQLLYSYVTANS